MTWTVNDILGIYVTMIFFGFIIFLLGMTITQEFSGSNCALYIGATIAAVGAIVMGAPIMISIVYFGEKLIFTFIEATEYLFANF